jgi:ribose/xylose/arabinose/galactoside ABC-type transport system permease subunit
LKTKRFLENDMSRIIGLVLTILGVVGLLVLSPMIHSAILSMVHSESRAWILPPDFVGMGLAVLGIKLFTDTLESGTRKNIFRFLRIFAPFLGMFVVYWVFYRIAPEEFRSVGNTKSYVQQSVIVGVAALGMTMVIISAGIDLSAGSVVALATVVAALTLKTGRPGEIGILLPILATLAAVSACSFCGFLNGFMISVFRIVPFIVTLGMMQIVRGAAKGISGQTIVFPPNSWLNSLMIIEPHQGVAWSVAPGVWIMFALMILCWAMLRYTVFGRHVYAVGSNESTARLCGINVGLNRIFVYTLCGLLTGIAGVLNFSAIRTGDPTGAVGLELDIIAAVVIGGGSFNGGEGSVIGSVIGAVIIAMLRNGCVLCGLENYITNILIGSIIIVAVGIDQLKHRRQA